MVINVTQNEIYNVMHSKIINKMRISNVLIIGLAILHFAVLRQWPDSPWNKSYINIYIFLHCLLSCFPCNFYVALELTLICKTKSDEESHEESKPFIKEDVEKNTVRRDQGKLLTWNPNMYFSLLKIGLRIDQSTILITLFTKCGKF